MFAFDQTLALSSASECTFDTKAKVYLLTEDEMVEYAKIIAYKVAKNLQDGYELDPNDDPIIYVDDDDVLNLQGCDRR